MPLDKLDHQHTNKMKKLTVKQIDNELRKLMTEQPNFQYAKGRPVGCFYYQGPTGDAKRCTGCIFGQAFQRLGISQNTLKNDCSKENISGFREPWLTDERPDYWVDIQDEQDSGATWGSLIHLLPTETNTINQQNK